MKTISLVLTLAACGPMTTQVFSARADSIPNDVEMLTKSIDIANTVAGCELIRYDPNALKKNFTFNSNQTCNDSLEIDKAEGETRLDPLNPPQVCVQSLTIVTNWASDAQIDSAMGGNVVIYLHEIGHAMGLQHTKNVNDIMFSQFHEMPDNGYDLASLTRYVEQLRENDNKCLNNN